jgi:hypothetical protein
MPVQVVEERHAVRPLECRAPVHDGLEQAGRGREVQPAPDDGRSPHRARDAVAQGGPDLGEREPAIRSLVQHPVQRKAAQHPGHGPGGGPDLGGHLGAGQRPGRQHVGHAEPGRDREQLGREVAVHEPAEPRGRRGRRVRVSDSACRRSVTSHPQLPRQDGPAYRQPPSRTLREAGHGWNRRVTMRFRTPSLPEDGRRPLGADDAWVRPSSGKGQSMASMFKRVQQFANSPKGKKLERQVKEQASKPENQEKVKGLAKRFKRR